MKGRARQHETVDNRHCHTSIDATGERTQHAARLRTVHIKLVVNASIARRNHERLSIDDEADVTDETLVENRVDRLAIEVAALRQTLELGAISLRKCHNQPHL